MEQMVTTLTEQVGKLTTELRTVKELLSGKVVLPQPFLETKVAEQWPQSVEGLIEQPTLLSDLAPAAPPLPEAAESKLVESPS